jgi:hypothetical protein
LEGNIKRGDGLCLTASKNDMTHIRKRKKKRYPSERGTIFEEDL